MASYVECGYWPVTNQNNLDTCAAKQGGKKISHMYDATTWPYRTDCPDEWRTLCGRRADYQISRHSLTDANCAECHEAAIGQGYGKVESRRDTVYVYPKKHKIRRVMV
jgi:hypothetical protein